MTKLALVFSAKQDGGVEVAPYNTDELAMFSDAEGSVLTQEKYLEGVQNLAAYLSLAPLGDQEWRAATREQIDAVGSQGLRNLVVNKSDFADEAALQAYLAKFFADIAMALPQVRQVLQDKEDEAVRAVMNRFKETIVTLAEQADAQLELVPAE